jgi:tetratricopeptide (TPR) repeat protein
MTEPLALVIPFGVPTDGQGLGLGLAALVHTFVQLDGAGVAIAQLHARPNGETEARAPSPVEAFVPPNAWKEIAGRGDSSFAAGIIITGAFEPPHPGQGTIQLLAFDPRDGRTRARVDASLDAEHAGQALVGALDQLWSRIGGRIGALEGLRDLGWEPLESILRAERCALHDPLRGGPHDRLAAMLHFGRAIGDAPDARYPAERLAAIALDSASGFALDPKLASAAVRALERATEDAPSCVELVEALGVLQLRLGRARDAELKMSAAIAAAPERVRPYALLSQALRAQGSLDGALAALQAAPANAAGDPMFSVERGMVLSARGNLDGAALAWREALVRDPVHPAAFCGLAALALRLRDQALSEPLVDAALAAPVVAPDVLRRAIQLALAIEAKGLARASRVARLCVRLLDRVPNDAVTALALAQAHVELGELPQARARLKQVEKVAPESSAAAEAQVVRFSIDDPSAHGEIQSVLRAAHVASTSDLGEVSARGRHLAMAYGSWSGWFAAAVADRRRERWTAARAALDAALEIAPGATTVHLEMVGALLAAGDPRGALSHARRAVALEGESPRTLSVLARALVEVGSADEALAAASRALAMRPDDEEARSLVARLGRREGEVGWGTRVRDAWKRWRGR